MTPAAPAFWAFVAFTAKPHVPRRMRTTFPVRLPAVSALQPSFVVVGVPVLASGNVPLVGAGGAAAAVL
jgi:hypothetical protein